jgi:heme oxygenase
MEDELMDKAPIVPEEKILPEIIKWREERNNRLIDFDSHNNIQKTVERDFDHEHYMKRIQTLEAEKAQKQLVIDDYRRQLKDCERKTAKYIFQQIEHHTVVKESDKIVETVCPIAYLGYAGEYTFESWYSELKQWCGVE